MSTDVTGLVPFGIEFDPAEEKAVRMAVDDYFLGWYDADPERMRRALHPELAKRGIEREPEPITDLGDTDADWMIRFAGRGRGRRDDPRERRYEVVVAEIHGRIATAIVHAVPYVEYIHLVRMPEGWRIVNTLWQPPQTP